MKKNLLLLLLSVPLAFGTACGKTNIWIAEETGGIADIFPDYRDVTIPCNIAPLNFSYQGKEECRLIISGADGETQLEAKDGLVVFPPSFWKQLTECNKGKNVKLTLAIRCEDKWKALKPFHFHIAADSIDPYLSYRLIPPGYEGWKNMGIYQRDLQTYKQTPLYENHLTDGNCVNCHAYCDRAPGRMLFHARAGFDGTIVIRDGETVKLNMKSDPPLGPLVYPAWHPSGRYVAFSINRTRQNFLNSHPDRIEVYDTASDVVIYDLETRQLVRSPLLASSSSFETFPAFSPDGKSLYFCSARVVDPLPARYKEVRYDLCRIAFDPADSSFGAVVDTLCNASSWGKSVSFPRVSPDGRFLALALHDHGTFSIWHKDADLYMLDLRTGDLSPLADANSDDVESYHSWSSNSRWMVFSSRRTDGLYTRPFITYIDSCGRAYKPFLLPQKDPLAYYMRLMYSYNIPELTSGKVEIDKHEIVRLLRSPCH